VVPQSRGESVCSDGDISSGVAVPGEEHRRKRHKEDSETAVVRCTVLYMTLCKIEYLDEQLIGKYSLYSNQHNAQYIDLFSLCLTCFWLTLSPSSRGTCMNWHLIPVS
jgi:hypothetical protein